MNRTTLFACAALAAASLASATDSKAASSSVRRPNILVIVTDDQRWDAIRAYGKHAWLQTPNMDRLAREGVMFTRAFCQVPLCAASRTSIFSGRYAHKNGVYGFESVPDDSPHLRPWLPDILGAHGYQRALFGKDGAVWVRRDERGRWVGAGPKHYPDGHRDLPSYKRRDVAEADLDGQALGIIRRTSEGGVIIAGRHPQPAGQTIDAFIADDAVAFIQERRDTQDAPFFLNVGFQFPHTPVLVPAPYDRLYAPAKMPLATLEDAERAGMSQQMQYAVRAFGMHGLTADQVRQTVAHYYAYNTYGDVHLGRVVDAFKAKSARQGRPWLVVLASDNGWHLGEHGMNAKFTFYDVAARLPLIVASSDDRFAPGTRYDGLVEFVDIVPTILAAAGLPAPDYLDGRDLRGMIAGTTPARQEAIAEQFHVMRRGMIRATHEGREYLLAIRTKPDRFDLERDFGWLRTAPTSELDAHLFDVAADPEQVRNLARDPRHAAVVEALRLRLQARLYDGRIEPRWKALLPQRHAYGEGKADALVD
jgi:arylsulfatase A-like enzyme